MSSDELLRTALIASFEERMSLCKREIEENPHRFSLAYKIRKRSIIRLARRYEETKEPSAERHFMPLRKLALIMAIIAAAVILSVGAYAAYLIINGFVFDRHGEYSDVTLDISEYQLKDSINELYWLPPESGCECVVEMIDDTSAVYNYEWNGNEIVFTQYTKFAAEHYLKLNTENANIYGVNVNGNNGFITTVYREKEDETKGIVWVMDGYIFSISIPSFGENRLVELAEMTVIKEGFE
ncbi:MAG: DUF4367 domain-containing protein [Oscillospiraceae bacterium]|nr:DUF4367 domain-containing protein [Oscillospiraceae bacterium]